jgi:multiple sugar transport system substrate-binding protein
MERRDVLSALGALSCLGAAACRRRDGDDGENGRNLTLVVKYQPLGAALAFQGVLRAFEAAHPGVEVVAEALPNSSDLAHQFFLTSLEGGAREFDLFVVDTVWMAEFARAGWLADLSGVFPPDLVRRDFLAGPAEAVIVGEKTFALPWYGDVGIMFYRSDLVERAPRTYVELIDLVTRVCRDRADMQGFVWQGRQYEGLICNVYETIWGHGGVTMQGSRAMLDTSEARRALTYLRTLIESGVSPRSVASAAEEEARRVFQDGRALFMRNWPYAWADAQREGSPVRGKVGVAPLPTIGGEAGHGALGGYEVGVHARISPRKRDLAVALAAHLTSLETNLVLALDYGRSPVRRAAYDDERLARNVPLLANLLPMFEGARSRPKTAYYAMISDTLESEFSAAITGIRTPGGALRRAQTLVDHIADPSHERMP